MTPDQVRWYVARARRMSPDEAITRVRDQARQRAWQRRRVRPGQAVAPVQARRPRPFPTTLDPALASEVPAPARAALVAAAERLRNGHWDTFGIERRDLVAPDWFLDPVTGRHAPSDRYAFAIRHRSEAETGNVKQVWELSRHQHLTLLAAAYFVTGDARYATRVDEQLRSWWHDNPFLSGIHWTSGIEAGLRLIAWAWIRRLLDAWPPVRDLFEHNETAVRQIFWHQQYLAGFRSSGTSANNHVIAEAAGRLVAACAFPWFDESEQWRASAVKLFEREFVKNTFASGVNRELATDYHGFVAELAYVAILEADSFGVALADRTWRALCAVTDAAAALPDSTGRPPRQGDGDEGVALRFDAPDSSAACWSPILAVGETAFGTATWWPTTRPGVFSTLVGALCRERRRMADRPTKKPSQFSDAGITILRTGADEPEIWCRCDAGPHGFLAIAAHAHADALSIEVRHDGVDVLADPGTYCYHGEAEWRSYFRSTSAHNTVLLAGRDQSRSGGPFLWVRPANARILALDSDDGAPLAWCAEHDGYEGLDPPALHRRTVRLEPEARRLDVDDQIETTGDHALVLHFHLGPTVVAVIDGASARLEWPSRDTAQRAPRRATLRLPGALHWSMHRGELEPVRGWYSPAFGVKTPSITLVGQGVCLRGTTDLHTELEFDE